MGESGYGAHLDWRRQGAADPAAWGTQTHRIVIPYILESNLHPFYSFRRLKNQMRIRIACGLDSRSRAGFWKNDRAAVRTVRTIQ